MSKHTKGPWMVDKLSPTITDMMLIPVIDNYNEDIICHVEMLDEIDEQAQANAALIASAPELLEALKAITDCKTPPMTWAAQGCILKAQRAIAKAEGAA